MVLALCIEGILKGDCWSLINVRQDVWKLTYGYIMYMHMILKFVLGGANCGKEIWNTRSGASWICNKPRDCKFHHWQWTRLQSTDWLPSLSPRPVQTNYFCWNCEWSASRGTWNILCQFDKYWTTATRVSNYLDMQFTASKVLFTNAQAYIRERRTLIQVHIPRVCLECLQFPCKRHICTSM